MQQQMKDLLFYDFLRRHVLHINLCRTPREKVTHDESIFDQKLGSSAMMSRISGHVLCVNTVTFSTMELEVRSGDLELQAGTWKFQRARILYLS
jgi:hypothetical protein